MTQVLITYATNNFFSFLLMKTLLISGYILLYTLITHAQLQGNVLQVKNTFYEYYDHFGEYVMGGQLNEKYATNNYIEIYDTKSNLLEEKRYFNDSTMNSIKYSYDSEGRVLTKSTYDDKNIMIAKDIRTYLNGNLTERKFYGADGRVSEIEKYNYDSLSRCTEIALFSPSQVMLEKTEFNYFNNGRKTIKLYFELVNGNMDTVKIVELYFNNKGQLDIEYTKYLSFDYSTKWVYFYDEKGRDVKWESLYENGEPASIHEFDTLGNLILYKTLSEDGELMSSQVNHYEFDSKNNWTSRKTLVDGIPKYIAKRQYIYKGESKPNLEIKRFYSTNERIKKNGGELLEVEGQDTIISNWSKGVLHGKYYTNKYGVRQFGNYQNGLKVGEWIKNYDGSAVEYVEIYENGQLMLEKTYIDQKLVKIIHFENGIEVSVKENYSGLSEPSDYGYTEQSNQKSSICSIYVMPSTGSSKQLKSLSEFGVNTYNYNSYTGQYASTVYGLLNAIYQGNFSVSPVIKVADCCIRDGYIYMACMWAWATVVYASGNNGNPMSYTPEEAAQKMMDELEKADKLCSEGTSVGVCDCLTLGLYGCP